VDFEAARMRLVQIFDAERLLTPASKQAFLTVRRELFVPLEYREAAYADSALPLAPGSTISQPSMIAIMLQELQLSGSESVLEVGSGSGYLLALLAAMGAKATGAEILPEIAAASRAVLASEGIAASVVTGDASATAFSEDFDRVVFSAAVDYVPGWAVRLLRQDGFVLAPVGREEQELVRLYVDRTERTGRRCRFVPFV
jgi:protein-L-isoaspartate(D-aspartate) O-methyltransferase